MQGNASRSEGRKHASVADGLLRVDTVYHEPDVPGYARGREILARFSDARRVEVPSHWNIPGLHGDPNAVGRWNRNKHSVLVLGTKKGLACRPFYRSCDFVAPSQANGCAMACTYCVEEGTLISKPEGRVPVEQIQDGDPVLAYDSSSGRLVEARTGRTASRQADPDLWVYELGTNSDLSVDAAVGDNVRDLVGLFRELPNAKATFAAKFVNRDLLDYDPRKKTRLRFSLMPPETSRLLDVRTSTVERRIAAIDDFVEAGYEVNVNFGPVIVKENWQVDYAELFGMIDAALSREAKAQLAAEVIFLTHTEELHEVNLQWHPEGEKLLWRPDIQEQKTSQASGERVLRYEKRRKRALVREFRELLNEWLPYCNIRYAF